MIRQISALMSWELIALQELQRVLVESKTEQYTPND